MYMQLYVSLPLYISLLSLSLRIDLEGEEFPEHLQPFLPNRTSHFLHELISFARSPLNVAAYDHSVRYEWPADRLRDTWDPEATVNVVTEQLQHSPIPGMVVHVQMYYVGCVYTCIVCGFVCFVCLGCLPILQMYYVGCVYTCIVCDFVCFVCLGCLPILQMYYVGCVYTCIVCDFVCFVCLGCLPILHKLVCYTHVFPWILCVYNMVYRYGSTG